MSTHPALSQPALYDSEWADLRREAATQCPHNYDASRFTIAWLPYNGRMTRVVVPDLQKLPGPGLKWKFPGVVDANYQKALFDAMFLSHVRGIRDGHHQTGHRGVAQSSNGEPRGMVIALTPKPVYTQHALLDTVKVKPRRNATLGGTPNG